MSFKATAWAFDQSPNKPPQKHLLFTLAHRADDKYQCYPSISCLIKDTGMGRRTIQEHLRELLAQGFINITERIGSSNIYTLSIKGADEGKLKFSFQQYHKKTTDPQCETRIQKQSINNSLSMHEENKTQKIPPVNDFTPEMKKAYDWAKKEPFWSPKIEKIVNFIRFYTLGDLKNQYLNFLRKKQTRLTTQYRQYKTSSAIPPAKKIKTKDVWERQGFQSEKDYQGFLGKQAIDKLRKISPEAFDPTRKQSPFELKINKMCLKQKMKRLAI
jgi:hypothetical protein